LKWVTSGCYYSVYVSEYWSWGRGTMDEIVVVPGGGGLINGKWAVFVAGDA
jgi:hypothetical protein